MVPVRSTQGLARILFLLSTLGNAHGGLSPGYARKRLATIRNPCLAPESVNLRTQIGTSGVVTEVDAAVRTDFVRGALVVPRRKTQLAFTGRAKCCAHNALPANAWPEWRGAERLKMQTGASIPRPLQAACSAFCSFLCSVN